MNCDGDVSRLNWYKSIGSLPCLIIYSHDRISRAKVKYSVSDEAACNESSYSIAGCHILAL